MEVNTTMTNLIEYKDAIFIQRSFKNTITGEIIQGKVAPHMYVTDIPDGMYNYHIRHRSGQPNKPETIEELVAVDFYGTIILNHPIQFPASDDKYIPIKPIKYEKMAT